MKSIGTKRPFIYKILWILGDIADWCKIDIDAKTKQQLARTGVKILGIVLNKVPMQKGSYYGSYYYGKYYGKYDGYYK